MKDKTMNYLRIIIFLSCFHISSAQSHIENFKPQIPFNFVLQGDVENGEGQVIFLYIPSHGLDNRIISKITNGKFEFKGTAYYIQAAEIRFENDLNQETFPTRTVFIEPGRSHFFLKINNDYEQPFIQNIDIKEGLHNKFFLDISSEFYKVSPIWITGDPVKNDSLLRYSYPTVRTKLLDYYKKRLLGSKFPPVSLYFLNSLLDFTESGPFQADQLNDDEKQLLEQYFQAIPDSLNSSSTYKNSKRKLEIIQQINLNVRFREIILPNESGELIKLSEIIQENEYTVVDFWWSGCLPCRAFNEEASLLQTELLKKGVKIVGINVDESKARWQSSSLKDGINWINLYAGPKSDTEIEYNVWYYPTKIIFDRNFNVVKFSLKNARELLEIGD